MNDKIDNLIESFNNECKKQGISRRDALKLASISGMAFLLNPSTANAVTKAKAAGNGVQILIIGAGASGCSLANYLVKNLDNAKITIVEPNPQSVLYQPGQTLIGGGVWTQDDIMANTAEYLPKDVKWIKDKAIEFDPENNSVKTTQNGIISYDYMVLATGLQLNYEAIDGISKEQIGKDDIGSIYFPDGATQTWKLLQKLIEKAKNKKDIKAIFTQPNTPIKCGGAPKKIAFLTHARFRDANLRDNISIDFYANSGNFFGVKEYNNSTIKFFEERKMNYHFKNNLISVDTSAKKATFAGVDGNYEKEYDFLHVVPPMSAPDAVKNSNLSALEGKYAKGGWVDVSKDTLVHNRYKNVFAIGDVAGIPTSKSAAAAREEYKICGENLISIIGQKEPTKIYDGYTACPLITDLGKVMMAEFNYKKEMSPKMPFLDPAQERWFWWFVKVNVLKPMYFHAMLKARA